MTCDIISRIKIPFFYIFDIDYSNGVEIKAIVAETVQTRKSRGEVQIYIENYIVKLADVCLTYFHNQCKCNIVCDV